MIPRIGGEKGVADGRGWRRRYSRSEFGDWDYGGSGKCAIASAVSATGRVGPFLLGRQNDATGAYSRIEVKWPGGETETFSGGPANRIVRLEQGKGSVQAR